MFVHHTRAPLEIRHPDHNKCAVVLEAVKDKPLRVALTRHPLTAPARASSSQTVWVGTKKRLVGRTKKLRDKKMDRTLAAPP